MTLSSRNISEIWCLRFSAPPASPADCTSRLMIPSAAQAEIHRTKDNIRTLVSTDRVTGGEDCKKINVCPEELHFPPSH